MTTVASPRTSVATTRARVSVPTATWIAVLCSRVLVVASAAAGSLFAQRHVDSIAFDPTGFSRGLGRVGNALAASTDRWDAVHYLQIAQHGYSTAVDTAYFPLYPLLIHVVGWFTRSYVAAGVLVSTAAFAVALELLYRLAREELDARAANAVVLLLAFAPLSLFFTAVYTESLFLALSVATFFLARSDRLLWASLAAAAASLTHIQGVLLLVPLAFYWWERQGNPRQLRALIRWQAAPLLLPFAALACLCVYLHLQGFGWIAPISNETNPAWHHQFVGPVIGAWLAIEVGASGLWQTLHGAPAFPQTGSFALTYPAQNLVYLLVLVVCAVSLLETWRRLPKIYALYSGLYLIVLISSPLKGTPLGSFDRYALMLFPLWIGAAAWLRERRLLLPVIEVGAALLLFYSFQFGRWLFVA